MLIGIFEAERSWSQAMHDKLSLEDNPDKLRKKYSMRMNLKRYVFIFPTYLPLFLRAVVHAKNLEALVRNSSRCDAPTKLEAQAYAAWLLGICCFEQRQWREAAEALKVFLLFFSSNKIDLGCPSTVRRTGRGDTEHQSGQYLQGQMQRSPAADQTVRVQFE